MIRRIERGAWGDDGLTLIDITIGLVILAIATFLIFNVFVTGIRQAKASGVKTEATAWTNREVEYLRFTYSCLTAGTWTIAPSSPACNPAGLEPALPTDFDHATVQVQDNAVGQAGLKRITIQVFTRTGKLIYEVVTYVTQFV
jgi:hypothetical protein